MSDDLKNHHTAEHGATHQSEVKAHHWASKFGISESRLKEVVIEFGPVTSASQEQAGPSARSLADPGQGVSLIRPGQRLMSPTRRA